MMIKRESLFKKVLRKKKEIFFACENLKISNNNDIKKIKKIWSIKKVSEKSLKVKDLKI